MGVRDPRGDHMPALGCLGQPSINAYELLTNLLLSGPG